MDAIYMDMYQIQDLLPQSGFQPKRGTKQAIDILLCHVKGKIKRSKGAAMQTLSIQPCRKCMANLV